MYFIIMLTSPIAKLHLAEDIRRRIGEELN